MSTEPPAVTTQSHPPSNESARLAALRNYCVLDTGRESRFDDLTRLAAGICETPVSLVSLVDQDRLFFKSSHGIDLRENPREGFCDYAIRQREIFEVPDTLEDPRFAKHPLVVGPPHVRFYAGAPLVTAQNLALGTLCVIDTAPRRLNSRQAETLHILARQVIAQLELNLRAVRDPLTGLYNRRQLEESLHREILRARRLGGSVGVMAIDVDHFKQVNDTFGHEVGDSALSAIADELARSVREDDVACRSGGDEFVIILPGTNEAALHHRAERLRRMIEENCFALSGTNLKLTVSIGLAAFPVHGGTEAALLHAADVALYEAKAGGRNRVVACPPVGTSSPTAGNV
jgi:diguanylate cyclase (GGDEF)-like protein